MNSQLQMMKDELKMKLVPELRFPTFEKTNSWIDIKLIDITDKNKKWSFTGGPFGSNLKSSDYVEEKEGVRIIQLQNIGDGEFKNNNKIYTSKEKADELLSCNIYPGDIIMSKMGDPVGRACLIPHFHNRYVMSSDGIRIAVDEDKYNKYFIYLVINSKIFRSKVENSSTGSTRKRIGLIDLKKLTLTIPNDKGEQQKIANCLSSLDNLLTAETEKLDHLKNHKKGLLQTLFPAKGETKPQYRFSEFEVDGDWTTIIIEELVKNNVLYPQKDGNHGNIHPKSSDFVNKGIPFIMASDIRNGKINYSKCKHISKKQANNLQKGFAKEEDVLLTHKGTVGEVAIIEENEFPYLMLTPQVTYYRVKAKSKLSNKFLLSFFRCDNFQNALLKLSGGGTRAYVGITAQGKLDISIPPTIDEQKKIALCFSSVEDLIQKQTTKIEALQTHKKGLMQQLFPNVNNSMV